MNVDLLIASLVCAFALWGAFSGVAKQVAALASVVLGYLLAHPIAIFLGPHVAKAFHIAQSFGVVAATLGAFVLVVVLVRLLLTPLIRRLLAGKTPDDRSLDRLLGLLFGALKASLFAWVVLSCLTYAEDNITLAGKRVGLSPRDSLLFKLARSYNLIAMTHFSPVEDLVTVVNATSDPKKLQRLQQTAAYQALQRDPRFRGALVEPRLHDAFEQDDAQALLKSHPILDLVQDPAMVDRLRAAAAAAREER